MESNEADTITIAGLSRLWDNWEQGGGDLPVHLTLQSAGKSYTAVVLQKNGRTERTLRNAEGTMVVPPEAYDDSETAILDAIMEGLCAAHSGQLQHSV